MSHDEENEIKSEGFRGELKSIVQEAVKAQQPEKQKSLWPTIIASGGSIILAFSFLATYAHLPKDVEQVNIHVGTHDSQIASIVSTQAQIQVTQARVEAVINDTAERVKRMEASQDRQRYEK
jgi:cell envelope opacity-associated protein A